MLELSTPIRKSGHSLPLLGCAPGLLALRVCGGAHRGRIIQIRSPKCTVGSAAGCTLRLRAAGVRPLHCWILRGPAGTLVRRRSPGTLLNGQSYEDAPLRLGDRLRIGSVELEVVECPAPSQAPAFSTLTQPVSEEPRLVQHDKVRELESCLTAANEEIARLEADAQQAWQTSITAAERAEQLRVALEQANVEAGEARGELETASAAMHAERQQSQAKIQQLENELKQARARQVQPTSQTIAMGDLQPAASAAQAQELADRIAALEAELEQTRFTLTTAQLERDAANQWEPRFREAEQQVERWQADVHGLQSQNDDLRQRLLEAKSQQAKASEDARRLVEREHDLNQQQAQLLERESQLGAAERRLSELEVEMKAAREASENEQSQRQAALVEREDQIGAAERRLAEMELELKAAREAVEPELNQRQAALLERENQVGAAERRLTEVEGELKAAREAIERDRCQQQTTFEQQVAELQRQGEQLSSRAAELATREAQLGRLQDQFAQAQADLQSRQESIASAQAELTACREQLQAEREDLQRQRESRRRWAEEPPALSDPLAQPSGRAEDVPNQTADERSTGGASDSQEQAMDSVLSRLVQSGVWRGDRQETPLDADSHEQAAERRSYAAGDEVAESLSARPQEAAAPGRELPAPPVAGEPQPSSSTPTLMLASEQHDEESIETYMERLMQRVRGDAANSSRSPLVAALQPQSIQPETPQSETEQPQADADATVEEPAIHETVRPEQFVPRSQPLDQSINLAAMREVANTAARSAIQHHHQKSHSKQAAGRLFTAGVLFLGSAALAYWAWETSSLTTAGGAGVALVAGTLWATRGFGRLLHSLRLSPAAGDAEASAGDAAAGSDSPADADSSAESGA